MDPVRNRPLGDALVSARTPAGHVTGRSNSRGLVRLQVPSGVSISLGATKPGYSGGQYGQASPFDDPLPPLPGTSLAPVVNLFLWPHSVVAGTVLDDAGEAVVGATVKLFEERPHFGRVRLIEVSQTRTDDRGRYRASGAFAGRLLVGSKLDASTGVTDDAQVPRWAYYPDALDVFDAVLVNVDIGAQLEGIDVAFPSTDTFDVEATVAGSLAPTTVGLRRASDPVGGLSWRTQTVGSQGRILFEGVPRGDYILTGLQVPPAVVDQAGRRWLMPNAYGASVLGRADERTVPTANADGETMWATGNVGPPAKGRVANLTLQLAPAARVRGRVQFDGRQPDSKELATAVIVPTALDGTDPFRMAAMPVNADGTFVTSGLPPGRYLLSVLWRDPSWYRKAMNDDGTPRSDTVVTVGSLDVPDAMITMSNRVGTVAGVVVAGPNASSQGDAVIFIPQAPALRIHHGGPAALVRLVRTNFTGEFKLSLPLGRYVVTAVRGPTPRRWQAEAVLNELARRGTEVFVSEGTGPNLSLRAVTWPNQ